MTRKSGTRQTDSHNQDTHAKEPAGLSDAEDLKFRRIIAEEAIPRIGADSATIQLAPEDYGSGSDIVTPAYGVGGRKYLDLVRVTSPIPSKEYMPVPFFWDIASSATPFWIFPGPDGSYLCDRADLLDKISEYGRPCPLLQNRNIPEFPGQAETIQEVINEFFGDVRGVEPAPKGDTGAEIIIRVPGLQVAEFIDLVKVINDDTEPSFRHMVYTSAPFAAVQSSHGYLLKPHEPWIKSACLSECGASRRCE